MLFSRTSSSGSRIKSILSISSCALTITKSLIDVRFRTNGKQKIDHVQGTRFHLVWVLNASYPSPKQYSSCVNCFLQLTGTKLFGDV